MQNYSYQQPQAFQNPTYTYPSPITYNGQMNPQAYPINQQNLTMQYPPSANSGPLTSNIPMSNPYSYTPTTYPNGPSLNTASPPQQYSNVPQYSPLDIQVLASYGCYKNCLCIMLTLFFLFMALVILAFIEIDPEDRDIAESVFIILIVYNVLAIIFYIIGYCTAKSRQKNHKCQLFFLLGLTLVLVVNVIYAITSITNYNRNKRRNECYRSSNGHYVCNEPDSSGTSTLAIILFVVIMLGPHLYVLVKGIGFYKLLKKNAVAVRNMGLPSYANVSTLSAAR